MADAELPEQRAGILYVDTSALLKLLVREAESTVIERELVQWPILATSIVTEVELPRAISTHAREDRPDAVIDGSLVLQGIIASAAIIPLSNDIVLAARRVSPVHVGALDAIHIASALSLDKKLAGVATYDNRMRDALKRAKVNVVAPDNNDSRQPPVQDPDIPRHDRGIHGGLPTKKGPAKAGPQPIIKHDDRTYNTRKSAPTSSRSYPASHPRRASLRLPSREPRRRSPRS